MQLLYVWIEDYKNIKKQGFNFGGSPYLFEYNPKDKELIVTDNPNYIEGFFNSDNNDKGNGYASISNITAIVGKNGSGKSTFLEWLLIIITNPLSDYKANNYYLVYLDKKREEQFQLRFNLHYSDSVQDKTYNKSFNKKIYKKTSFKIIKTIDKYNTVSISIDGESLEYKNEINPIFFTNILSNKLLVPHYNSFNNISTYKLLNDKISLKEYLENEKKDSLRFLNVFKNNNHLPFKIPKKISLSFKINSDKTIYGDEKYKSYKDKYKSLVNVINDLQNIEIKTNHDIISSDSLNKFIDVSQIEQLCDLFINININSNTKTKHQNELVFSNFLHFIFYFGKERDEMEHDIVEEDAKNSVKLLELKYTITNNIKDIIEEIYTNLLEQVKEIINTNKKAYIINEFEAYKNQIDANIEYINRISSFISDNTNGFNLFLEFDKAIEFVTLYYATLNKIDDYLEYNWTNQSNRLYLISTGESAFITIYSRFFSIVKSIREYPKHILILIDEGDIYLHPDWQKRFIKYMIDFLKECFPKYFIQIILTSHSPFVISDLPKENVIFLDTYKEGEQEGQEKGNCKVVKGIDKEQTFGANIHTLLSDGFFMEGGLMGEFAKGKIKGIVDTLDKIKKRKDKCEKDNKAFKLNTKEEKELTKVGFIINLIGEPIIKNRLKSYFKTILEDESPAEKVSRLEKELAKAKEKLSEIKQVD